MLPLLLLLSRAVIWLGEFTGRLLTTEDGEGGIKSAPISRKIVVKNSTPKLKAIAAPPAIEPMMMPSIVHLIRYERFETLLNLEKAKFISDGIFSAIRDILISLLIFISHQPPSTKLWFYLAPKMHAH